MTALRAATVAWGWAVLLAALGAFWTLGGAGYPFGRNDAQGATYTSLLSGLERPAGGPAVMVLGVVAGLVAVLLQRREQRRTRASAAGLALALGLIGVVADGRMILMLPPLGLFPIAWLAADWPAVFQAIVVAGAAALLVASLGRLGRPRSPARWIRAGTVATFVAMACPLPYALIRLAWSRGWSVGAPEPFVASLLRNQPENVVIEPVLAAFAIGGAVLTSGLLCRWGRVFPRWVPMLRGRAVPAWFPLGLGGSAAIGIFGFGRGLLLAQLGYAPAGAPDPFQLWGQPVHDAAYWGAGGLGWLFFPLWAVSLALALTGYHLRQRYGADGPGRAAPWWTPDRPFARRACGAATRRWRTSG